MMRRPHPARQQGFTLIELMVVCAVVVIVAMLAAPSFREMMEMQRLRGTSAQLVTDIQFARSEAVGRQEIVGVAFGSNSSMTCYVVHACADLGAQQCSSRCNCLNSEGARCNAPARELRTVLVPIDSKVGVRPVRPPTSSSAVNVVQFDPATGGMAAYYVGVGSGAFAPLGQAWVETSLARPTNEPKLRAMISVAGRPSVCTPDGRVSGVQGC